MATNTFERKIELRDVESIKKLMEVMNEDSPKMPLIKNPFSNEERKRSENLLNRSLLRSRH